jgi:hypothetical protein
VRGRLGRYPDEREMNEPQPRSGEYFAPLPLFALLVLVVNDCWLKAKFHNALTGKLSDVAVCFLMPLFLSELLGLGLGLRPRVRLVAGAAVTAVLFTALEIVPPVTSLALRCLERIGPTLGIAGRFRMTSDPTDLACLVFVPLAVWYGERRLRLTAGAAGAPRGSTCRS